MPVTSCLKLLLRRSQEARSSSIRSVSAIALPLSHLSCLFLSIGDNVEQLVGLIQVLKLNLVIRIDEVDDIDRSWGALIISAVVVFVLFVPL